MQTILNDIGFILTVIALYAQEVLSINTFSIELGYSNRDNKQNQMTKLVHHIKDAYLSNDNNYKLPILAFLGSVMQ